MVLNIAHRGGAGLAPENTISCFEKGIMFADMIELDIQPSIDKYLMVIHDRRGIERTTNGTGIAPNLTYKYLRSLDAGSWFNSDFKGEIIPTLSEVLERTAHSNIQYNIELKYYDPESDWFEKKIIETIRRFNIETRTIIASRYVENITRVQKIDPTIECTILQKERDKYEYLDLLLKFNLKTAQIRRDLLWELDRKTAEKGSLFRKELKKKPSRLDYLDFISKCAENNVKIFLFYADDLSDMREAIQLGMDGILTNYPDRLRMLLNTENIQREI